MVNNHLRLAFKMWNYAMGLGGIATIFYGILIFRVTGRETSSSDQITIPWFLHAFLFMGIVLCAVTCLGHLAANTANTCCLSTYIVIILVLLILETLIMTDAFLDPNWEKEVPPSFDDFADSVVTSDYIWKYFASALFLTQAICVLLAAMSIHDHVTDGVDDYDSDYEDEPPRHALLFSVARWQQSERFII